MSNAGILDRIVSVLSYSTFGIFGVIWLICVNIAKKSMSSFLVFNIYQAIFISLALTVLSLLYQAAMGFLSAIPFLKGMVLGFDLFFMGTPVYFGFTLSGLFILMLLLYLSIISLSGQRPYIPIVSDIISGYGG